MMAIGGMLATDRRITIEANFPYRGLVDQICRGWEASGFSKDYRPPHADYLVKVVIQDA